MLPAPKRLPPDDVPPVTVGGVRYEVIHWGKERDLGQNGGILAAVDPATGREMWTMKVYRIDYDPDGFEFDMQDRFIARLEVAGSRLRATTEDGAVYLVDPATRTSVPQG